MIYDKVHRIQYFDQSQNIHAQKSSIIPSTSPNFLIADSKDFSGQSRYPVLESYNQHH